MLLREREGEASYIMGLRGEKTGERRTGRRRKRKEMGKRECARWKMRRRTRFFRTGEEEDLEGRRAVVACGGGIHSLYSTLFSHS